MALVIQIPKDGEPQYRATGGRSLENCSIDPQQGATPRCRGFGQDGKVLDAYGVMIFRTTGSNCIAVTDQFTGASRQVCW